MPLQIKVGHRYRTRSGDVVGIVKEEWTNDPWTFCGRVEGKHPSDMLWFAPTGRWAMSDHKFDLIEELPGDGDLLTKK